MVYIITVAFQRLKITAEIQCNRYNDSGLKLKKTTIYLNMYLNIQSAPRSKHTSSLL